MLTYRSSSHPRSRVSTRTRRKGSRRWWSSRPHRLRSPSTSRWYHAIDSEPPVGETAVDPVAPADDPQDNRIVKLSLICIYHVMSACALSDDRRHLSAVHSSVGFRVVVCPIRMRRVLAFIRTPAGTIDLAWGGGSSCLASNTCFCKPISERQRCRTGV